MKLRIYGQAQEYGTAEALPDGRIRVEGPRAKAVRYFLFEWGQKTGREGEDLLYHLARSLKGSSFWTAELEA